MSIKLKVMGLSVVAALVVSAVGVMSASATDGNGHFVSQGNSSVIVDAVDHPTDKLQFTAAATVECHQTTFQATTTSETTTSVTITPTYSNCTSTFGNPAIVHPNGCQYTFTIKQPVESAHNTVHIINCTSVTGHVITTPTCTITVTPNQTPTGGVTYTTKGSGSTHDITVGVTVSGLHATYVPAGSFGCAFQSTTANASLHGSVTAQGFNSKGIQLPITAT